MRVKTDYEKELQEAKAFQDQLVAYQRDNGLRGFFPLPWAEEEGLWSASILVKNARNADIVEFGGMSYVLGEAIHALDGRLMGEYYPYKVRGAHDHDHCFLDVLAAAVCSGGRVEAEEADRWYAPWMLEQLKRVAEDRNMRCRLYPWASRMEVSDRVLQKYGMGQPEIPCFAGGKRVCCREMDEVYGLAALYPQDFRLERAELCSREQRACIEAVRQYQLAALAGEAD